MDWFRKHADSIAVISVILASTVWINGKFNEVEKDIAVIKTVLIMKQILPPELATHGNDTGNR